MWEGIKLTWQGLFDARCAQACPDLAPDGQQIKGQNVWTGGRRPQLLVPEHKARRFGVTKYQILSYTGIDLHLQRSGLVSALTCPQLHSFRGFSSKSTQQQSHHRRVLPKMLQTPAAGFNEGLAGYLGRAALDKGPSRHLGL